MLESICGVSGSNFNEVKDYFTSIPSKISNGIEFFFDAAAKSLCTMEGLEKISTLALHSFALFIEDSERTQNGVEKLEKILSGAKSLRSGCGWISCADDFFKKDWIDSDKTDVENFLNGLKRISLVACNIIGVFEFAFNLDLLEEFSLSIGPVSVKNIFRMVGTVTSLVKNCLNFSNLDDTEIALENKKWAVEHNTASSAKMASLKEKLCHLEHRDFLRDGGQEDDFQPRNYDVSYLELKRRVSLEKSNERLLILKESFIDSLTEIQKLRMNIGAQLPSDERIKEIEKLQKTVCLIAFSTYEMKKNIKALKSINTKIFAEYKIEQFKVRKYNLILQYEKSYVSLTSDVAKMIVLIIGVFKSCFGITALTEFFNISLETTTKKFIYFFSFTSSSMGYFRFLFEEYSEKEKVELSIGVYSAIYT